MFIYLLCGLFCGVLLGSWGAYAWLKRVDKPVAAVVAPVAPVVEDKPDAEAIEAQRKADEAAKKFVEGMLNIVSYHGKPKSEDGGAK